MRDPARESDSASSHAPPILERKGERPSVRTDLASLRGTGRSRKKKPQAYTWTDGLVDFLTPFLIFLMMLSVLYFLLDVRFVFTEELDTQVRRVAFFFVMGVVALNRLVAKFGKNESMGYQIAMGVAVLVFAVVATRKTGSLARGFMDIPYIALGFNVTVLAFIWWVTNRLTRECCVDENAASGEVGLFTAASRDMRIRVKKLRSKGPAAKSSKPPLPKTPGEPHIFTSDLVLFDPCDPNPMKKEEAPPPKPTKRLPRRHPGITILYTALPVMVLFAVGQRLLDHGGRAMVIAGNIYVGIYTVSALLLLMLSSLRSVRTYFRSRKIHIPAGLNVFWLSLGTAFLVVVVGLVVWFPVPSLPRTATVDYHEYDPAASGKTSRYDYHERETSAPSKDPSAESDEEPSGGEDGEKQGDGEGKSEGQDQQGEGESGEDRGENQESRSQESEGRQSSQKSPSRPPSVKAPNVSGVAKYIGIAAIMVLALFMLYAMACGLGGLIRAARRRGKKGDGLLGRLFAAFDRFFSGLGRLPLPSFRRPKIRISRAVALSAKYANPENAPMSLKEKIAYSYEAFCALAYDMGVPRDDDQTPLEFAGSLPEPLRPLRAAAWELTQLYLVAAYSAADLGDADADRLRAFWIRFDGFRRRVVR